MGLSSFVLKLINNNVKLSFAVEVIESSFVVLASAAAGPVESNYKYKVRRLR